MLSYGQERKISTKKGDMPPPPPPKDQEMVFVEYDSPPSPVHGLSSIQEKLVYPEVDRKSGNQGEVHVALHITAKGEIKATKIVKSANPSLDKSAVDALKAVKWKPAMKNDTPIAAWITVPIAFRLNNCNKKDPY
jgi:protein TonB